MKSFASDNYAGVHPKILKAISEANSEHASAYGADPWTGKLNEKIKDIFGAKAEAFPVFNGTGANIVALKAIVKSYESVLCSSCSHIYVDECGAAESLLGVRLIDVATTDGKLSPEKLKPFTLNYGNEHQTQSKILSLTQSTEHGTLYKISELEELKNFAKEKGMKVFVDGARLANAIASLGVSPRKMIEAAGADILTLGGTKNGLLMGELVVVLNPDLVAEMKYYRKQLMQLSSKMRFLSAQFLAYLENDFWLENANLANTMAKKLCEELSAIPQIKISQNVEANAVFAKIPRKIVAPLQEEFPFYVWDEGTCEVRWMCSFDTTEKDVEAFVKKIKEFL